MAANIDNFLDAIEKVAGGSERSATVSQWLDTGFAPLNYALSSKYDGGMPVGRIVEIFGPESSGKTAIATRTMIAAQKANGFAVFHDHERSFDERLGETIGLSLERRFWRMKKPKTYEDSLDNFVATAVAARKAGLPMEAPLVFVFDSLASMIPKSQLERVMGKQGMNDQTALARATSATFKIVASIAEETSALVIFLNQIRTKPGVMYGDPTTTPGGGAPKYYASIRMQLGANRISDKEKGEVLGQAVTARMIKNKVTAPFKKAQWNYLFNPDGSGHFDIVGSTIDFMADKGVLPRHGAYIEWPLNGKKYHRGSLIKQVENDGGEPILRAMLMSSGVEADVESDNFEVEALEAPEELQF